KLAMDEKLYKYWIDPDLKGDKRVKKLTPDIILSHRTGFDNWRTMNDEQKLRFNSDPGTAFSYSGEGYEYLRKSLEIKFDKTFSELVKAYILGPLNMQNTYLSWSDEVDEKTYAGEFKSLNEPYEITKSAPSAADDLLTTALDLGKFCEKLLERISTGAYHQYIEAKTEAMPGIKFSYGWIRFDELPNGGYALFNAGGDTGVSAMMCLLPETKEGIVILSNGENRGMVINLMKMALGANGAEMVSRFPQG
ncbi:MAG: serine hydrolase domain-containing protein, partial [Bacteroidota bacterium]